MEENNIPKRNLLALAVDGLAGILLFAATAAVVWWQNSRLTVLYDLCGVLEPATRIAQGDIPYLDFPFPYAPLTFLMQAAVIRFTGAVYWHHIAYACIIAGLATVLTWRIIANLLAETCSRPRLGAFLLSLPITVLGVYCVFPHPFYDPDACFVVLLGVWLMLGLERKNFPSIQTFLLGMLLVVPLFVKQNIGLAFLGSTGIWLLIMIGRGLRIKESIRPYLLLIGGIFGGLSVAAEIIHYTCGIENYKYWTLIFAAARRSPQMADMLAVYADLSLVLWAAIFLLGAWLVACNRDGRISGYLIGLPLMAAPFVWPILYLLKDPDASERAERLVGLWPFTFIVLLALGYLFIRRLKGVTAALPFILIATAHGVFLSQQLWGSTYAIWPLLMILLAILLLQIVNPIQARSGVITTIVAASIAVSVTTAGAFYVYSNERLEYVNFEDGEMQHSSLPQLAGLSMRGDWIPDFEELIKYTDENIPRDAGILYLPGEDLFFYTTGRRPHFPVLLFDVTNNPLSPDEIREKVLPSDIEWIIYKNETQVEADDMIDSRKAIFEKLKPDFRSVESLNNYEIYKRRHADDPPDDEDDSGDDDNSDDDESDN